MWIWNCTHAPVTLDRRWLFQVMVGEAKAEAPLNVLTCLLQGLCVGSVGQYWPGGTVSQSCGGSNKLPTLRWTPSHRILKLLVMDRDLPLSSQCDYFLHKNYLLSNFKQHCWEPADTATMLFNCPRNFHPLHLTVWQKMSFHQVSVNLPGEWAGVWYFDTQRLQAGKGNHGRVGMVAKRKSSKPRDASVENEMSLQK